MALTAEKYYSFPIAEITKSDDGDFEIVGVATDGSIDADQQIVDPRWAGPPGNAIQSWLSSGANVRVMHNPQRDPAGIGVKAWTDSSGATWVRSRILEPVAQKLIKGHALRAYSIGISDPQIVRDPRARGGRIVGGSVTELTVCDRPSNGSCGITICKSVNGRAAYVGKAFGMKAGKPGKVEKALGKALRRYSDDPAELRRWLAKQAQADHRKSLRAFAAASLDSPDPQAREMARAVLGRYGFG